MLLLALQLAGSRSPFADPDPLPDAPMLERVLYENPWPLAVGLVIVGLLAMTGLRRAGRWKAGAAAGAVLIGLAAAAWLTARLVTTEREVLTARTEELIRSAIAADPSAAQAMVREDATLTLLGRESMRKKGYLVELIRQDVAARYKAKESRVRWVTAAIDGPGAARTQAKVSVRSSLTEGDLTTTWLLEWRKDAAGAWQVWRIEAQQIGLMPQGTVGDI